MATSEEIEAATTAIREAISKAYATGDISNDAVMAARFAAAALDAAAAVRARTEVSDAAFSAGVYAVADALCASQYVNAPDASFVLTLAHHAFAAGIAAQAATLTEAK